LFSNETGAVLRGDRYKDGLTQIQFSKLTGIPQRHFPEMENGKRPINKKNAKKFADFLDIIFYIIHSARNFMAFPRNTNEYGTYPLFIYFFM
jgi:transcriptional regulator with XRE-family HTH domain